MTDDIKRKDFEDLEPEKNPGQEPGHHPEDQAGGEGAQRKPGESEELKELADPADPAGSENKEKEGAQAADVDEVPPASSGAEPVSAAGSSVAQDAVTDEQPGKAGWRKFSFGAKKKDSGSGNEISAEAGGAPVPLSEREKPLGMFGYLLMLLVLAIPIYNIFALIRWSVSGKVNINKRNFARAVLVLSVVVIAALIALPVTTGLDLLLPGGPTEWMMEELAVAADLGIVPRAMTRNFQQEASLAELTELAVNVYETEQRVTVEPIAPNPFTDTRSREVLKAATLGIISYPESGGGFFNPDKAVTRQDMALIFYQTAQAARPDHVWDTRRHIRFAEHDSIEQPALDALYFAYNAGLIGVNEGRVAPDMVMSREEAILCAKRLFEAISSR